jgi:GRASP55/65 PDZ-like domain
MLTIALDSSFTSGVPFTKLDNTLIEMIKASQDMPLPLTVYNYKSQSLRDVSIIPTRNWGGQGMLGVTIRFDTYHNAEEHMVRVLGVAKNSPADLAGLQANSDYLLGTAENVSL